MLSPGTIVGKRYRLDERVANSGTYHVWRGVDESLGRMVAVKIRVPLLRREPGFHERFRDEARAVASINHPGVVNVYDYVSDESAGTYLVMEYIEGGPLSHTLSRLGRLTPARTMALVAQAANALRAGHEKGLVHGEVGLGKLLIRPDDTLVLTGFGIARSPGDNISAAGSVVGDTIYFSPEQANGLPATYLSDIFALGLVAYQCLSGHHPFEGDNWLEKAVRIVRGAAPPLPPDIPSNVRAIVRRAMAKDPADRWPSAAAFGQAAVGR